MSFKKMFYLCIVSPMLKAPMGKRWADIHMVKGVFVRFGFDAIRISQIQRQVKNKATGTPHEVYYIQLSLASIGSSAVCCRCGVLYTYIGVGLSALYQRCTLKDDISYLLPT